MPTQNATNGLYLHNDSRLAHAWAPWFSHEYINYFSVNPLSWLMDLPAVKVLPNPGFNDRQNGPHHQDIFKESFKKTQNIDRFYAFDYENKNGVFSDTLPAHTEIEPWKVLVLYSIEPDLKLDCELDLGWSGKLTGGSHGLRHMQFTLLGKTIGVATTSLMYHVDASRKAFLMGNDYWGWRFLSRATHYLADLGNPFHIKVAPSRKMITMLSRPKRTFKILSAMHTGYEIYVQQRFRQEHAAFKEALSFGVRQGAQADKNFFEQVDAYKKQASDSLSPIFNCLMENFGNDLINAFEKMNKYPDMDAAKQTMMCSKDAAGVLFKKPDHQAIRFLDNITTDLLREVGIMMGMLFEYMKRSSI